MEADISTLRRLNPTAMAWGVKGEAALKRLWNRMVTCSTCVHMIERPYEAQKSAMMQQNDCKVLPTLPFFTHAPHVCKHYKRKWKHVGFLRGCNE